ncbi:MAG: SNF2-related protein [Syntrophales bacterium]|nr:SNF2-related protein [Syntrophales bacterium]
MKEKKFLKKKKREKKVRADRSERTKKWEAEDNYLWARSEYSEGNLKTARHYAQKAINCYPNHLMAHHLLAQICMDEDDFGRAAELFRSVLKLRPGDVESRFFTGYSLTRHGSYEKAIDAFQGFLDAIKGKRLDQRLRSFKKDALNGIKESTRILKSYADAKSLALQYQRQNQNSPVIEPHKRGSLKKETLPPEDHIPVDISPFEDKSLLNQSVEVKIISVDGDFSERIPRKKYDPFEDYNLLLQFQRLNLVKEFDELLCLEHLQNVDKYWYQIETVSNVLKRFRGRVLLADEVGLGKTIEAGMLLKEYTMRGMIKKVLILTPPSLVSQWQEEMRTKFNLEFSTTDDILYRESTHDFWHRQDCVVASINTAKSRRNFDTIASIDYDLLIVDEAHYLRNKRTLNYKLVNSIKKKFIFLLSATPVQNNLLELYNLITLLRPGTLSTETEFKKEYIKGGNLRVPNNPEKLRKLLRDVMIRNTRSLVDVRLPKRFATTFYVEPLPIEKEVYQETSSFIRSFPSEKWGREQFTITNLQMAAGSSPLALEKSIKNLLDKNTNLRSGDRKHLSNIISRIREINHDSSKGNQLTQLIRKNEDKKIIFVRYVKTLEYLSGLLRNMGYPFAVFSGNMTPREKDISISAFRDDIPILLSTETGGEGRNLQFCNTLINYDLPWNPMRLEQRIGRLHRIGQKRDVYVFNLCMSGSIEDYMMRILHDKLNMFELVIGEIDTILGNLKLDNDFSNIVMNLWVSSKDDSELKANFDRLGEDIVAAKKTYEKTKELDEIIFGEDYEV